MQKTVLTLVAAIAALASAGALAASTKADVVVLMDESGSMSGEQAWIPGTITSLDAGLISAGLTAGNRYGLVGFSASAATPPSRVRSFLVGGGQFGTPAELGVAAGGLQITGGTEDGYAAINAANAYSFAATAARNYILVTDEDRDNTNAALTFANMLTSMTGTNTLLNAVVNATFKCGDNSAALGIIGTTGYKADGSGGFTKCSGASFVSGAGTTGADYVNLALATGGGAWNLNILRSGGNNAVSFTNAFIDGKIDEIVTQIPGVPEPETYAMMLAGLGAIGYAARRRKFGARA